MKRRIVKNARQELVRKAVHVLFGIILVLLVHAGFVSTSALGLVLLVFGALVLFNLRYPREAITRVISMNRADARIPGIEIFSYLLGSYLVLLLFPQQIALAAIMILAFGDPFAHLVSTGFGGVNAMITKESYLYGTVGGAIVGGLAAWTFVSVLPAMLASAVAMFVEASEVRIADHHIDDNFTIPLVAGVILWGLSYVIAL